jgi:Protein of unknown function (DUF2380)
VTAGTAGNDQGMRMTRLAVAASVAAAALAFGARPSEAADPAPIKIAVFEFELNDTSGGSGIIPQDAIDTENLKLATENARRLLAASGRYSIVDTSGAGEPPKWGLQSCRGCESEVAKKLGADQSLVGVITRPNRVGHALQIVIRDAKTGALVGNHFTGFRDGANYAWPRAVKWLMENSILASQDAK